MTDFTTSAEEKIKHIYQNPDWFSHVDDRLRYRPYVMPENSRESLDDLVEWYTNKKSKRVRYAGVKLRKMFLDLPPTEQRKVGMALLTGGKLDTEWVCQRLDNYKPSWDKDWVINWHPCYSEFVENVWSKFKGKYCGRLLIQFLDAGVVRRHMEELLKYDELYFGLCRRFVGEPWFSVDTERLAKCTSINAYLSVLSSNSSLTISDEEAERLLYQWVATVAALSKKRRDYSDIFWRSRQQEHRTIYAWGFDTALYYLLKMGKDDVVERFLQWDKSVCDSYHLRLHNLKDNPDYHGTFVETLLENIPKEYKYLSFLNEEAFQYAFSAGQPLTKPQPFVCLSLLEGNHSPYLSESPTIQHKFVCKDCAEPTGREVNKVETKRPMGEQEEYEEMLRSNPNIQRLIGNSELFPSNVLDNSDCPF